MSSSAVSEGLHELVQGLFNVYWHSPVQPSVLDFSLGNFQLQTQFLQLLFQLFIISPEYFMAVHVFKNLSILPIVPLTLLS